MEFLDVRTDYAFKKVFGSEQSKGILIDFLNAIIYAGQKQIVDLTIVDPYQIPLIRGMKDSYVDVKAVLSNNTKVIIEMQVLHVEGFEQRILYNAAKLYSTQLKRSDEYVGLEPIIAVTITDFSMFVELPKVISYWHLREKESLIKYSDDIELIFVELPKFTKTLEELETITDKWIYFLRHAGKLDFVPKMLSVEPYLVEAFQIANMAGLSEEEHEIQFKRRDFIWLQQGSIRKAKKDGLEIGRSEGRQQGRLEGKLEGRLEGKLEGRLEGKLEVAQNMLKQGVSLEMVIACTGFTEAELKG